MIVNFKVVYILSLFFASVALLSVGYGWDELAAGCIIGLLMLLTVVGWIEDQP